VGLSLRKIGDAIGGAITSGASAVGNVAQGVERQLNPFDNGATYSNPVARGPVPGSIVSQVNRTVNPFNNNSNISQGVGGLVHGTENMGIGAIQSMYDIGRGAAASATNNSWALFNANQAKATDNPQFLAPFARPLVQAAETVVHPVSKHTFTPTTPEQQRLLGATPIQNIQAGVASNYNKTHNPLEAGAYGVGQALQDVAAVVGAKVSIKGVAKPVARALDNTIPINNEIGAVGKNVNKPVVGLKTTTGKTITESDFNKIIPATKGTSSLDTTSPISGRTVDPQALADLPPAEQMKLYGQNREPTFNGPSLKAKSQRPETKINLTAQIPKAAIGDNTYIMGEHARKFNDAINVGDKLSDADKAKLSDALNGKDVGWVDNPELFAKTTATLKDAYDHSLAVDRLAGGKTAKFNNGNFSPLYFKADTAALDKLGIPKEDQYDLGDGQSMYVQAGEDSPLTAGKYKGYRNIQRKYGSYSDAADQTKGILQPLNSNALEDARMYANRGHSTIEGQLLYKQLKNLAPDEVSQDLNQKVGANGDRLVHAANGQLPFNVSKDLNKQLTGFKSSKFDSKLGEAAFKTVEVPSKGLRKVAFLGAPIHYFNLTRSFLSTTIPSGHGITAVKGVGEALGGSLHPKIYQALQDAADTVKPGQDFSTREFAGHLGIIDRDTRPNLLRKGTSTAGKVEKYSPFALQMRNMNRFNNVLGWKLAERVQELGIKPGSAEATAIGTEINKVIDRINPKMEGLNPIGERLATSGSLAPHWIRANIGLVKDAVKNSIPGIGTGKTGFGLSNAGDIARTNVLGGRLLFSAVAVLASAIATGEAPTLHKIISESGLNPNNPYPNIDSNSKTKAKYPGAQQYGQVLNLPSDPIGMAVGLLTDPKHFAIARETPALSAATQAITNQDFFGNPIVDKSQPGWQQKMAVATTQKLLPFGTQNLMNKSLTPAQKADASVGFRTKTDPNDPNYTQTQDYFNGLADAKKGLDAQAIRAIDENTASKKNPLTGEYIAPNANDTFAKTQILLQNPTAIDALRKMNLNTAKQGGKVDPLWTQDAATITKVLQYQSMPPGGADRTHWEAQNGAWYNPLAAQRSTFFGSLPAGDPNKPQAPIQYPNATPAEAAAQKQFFAITDSTQRAQFLQEHPEVQTQLDAQVDYNNKMREATGYSALDKFPTASPDVQKVINEYNAVPKGGGSKGGNKYRSQWITNNPVAYKAMSDYYTQASLYGLQKEAGQAQFADSGASQKFLKDAYSLGQYDIVKNPDGTYALGSSYSSSGSSSGGSGGSKGSGGSGSGRISRTAAELQNPFFDAVDIGAGGKKSIGKAQKPKVTKATGGGYKSKPGGYQPKVSMALPNTKSKVKLKASKV